ncbi:MAG: acyl-CoA dehydrogenase family protein [Hyphomicrobiales bacterium]|nr:acyl-CoA dehydrogenase family protein [Hyphomicrobiales bacterium]
MNFEFDERAREMRDRVETFFRTEILPLNPAYRRALKADPAEARAIVRTLQDKARNLGLWNLAVPGLDEDAPGVRLTNLQFAPLAEIMGRLHWASEVFNCHAPDVPNMEVLAKYGTPEQKRRWLAPLLNAEIRSCFGMTEPDVASSDANNIATRIERVGDEFVINGRKWFATAAANPDCRLCVLVGVTDPDAPRGRRHSVVLVPMDSPGLEIVRKIPVFHHVDETSPHTELRLENVRIPVSNLLGKQGEGFAVGQARLGPARIHHCMRAIGTCEVLIQLMYERAGARKTFGRAVIENANVRDMIASSRLELEQCRLMIHRAAWTIDTHGDHAARRDIALIKVAVARAYQAIADRALQIFGAMGVTDDTPVAAAFTQARAFRIYDGPDEVHLRGIFGMEKPGAAGESRFYLS